MTEETVHLLGGASKSPVVLVVCLCARWCNVCEDYRSVFDQVRASAGLDGPESVFIWLDIDDDDDLLHTLEVEQFPTLLIAVDESPRFFGPLASQATVLERMVVSSTASDPSAAELKEPELRTVVARIHSNLQNLRLR